MDCLPGPERFPGKRMLPSSLAIIVTGLVLGCIGIAAFAWGWLHGQFDRLEEQARTIFDERDCRLERPWESAAQREERSRTYGTLIKPDPGEWGGAV
jgi:cbb3-type cytochrome oxidase maturation protein